MNNSSNQSRVAIGGASSGASYSKVPGPKTVAAASMMVNGGNKSNKPPANSGRSVGRALGGVNAAAKRGSSRNGAAGEDEDQHMSSSNQQRSGSAQRRSAAAAAYNSQNLAGLKSGLVRGKVNPNRPATDSVFDFTEQNLMEQLGTPDMLLKELKMAKRELETLKNQLEVKDKSVANYRREADKYRKENIELKRQVTGLKARLTSNERAGENQAAIQNDRQEGAAQGDDLGEARMMAIAARNRDGGNRAARNGNRGNRDLEASIMAQMQMAMHMSEVENRMNERQMIMMALNQGGGAQQAQAEEERLLQRAIEESKGMGPADDPNNPDVDRMTYEQLMELQENAGSVNRGYSKQQIDSLTSRMWYKGRTKEESCLICMEQFTNGKRIKALKCGHEYDATCIDKWLAEEKRCPVCSCAPF